MSKRIGSSRRHGTYQSVGSKAGLCAAALLISSQAVHAQATAGAPSASAQEQTDGALAEIVVTAQFKAQRAQDIPLSITAISGDLMEARNQTDVAQVAHGVPNVFVEHESSGNGAGASAYIRGIGQVDPSFAVEPGVGIYVDDVYYGVISGSLFETLDLDRVEILRGPQGTLAGKNSIGGAIKLYSKKADGDTDGYIDVGYGRFNRINIRGAASFNLIPDKLDIRVSASSRRADGFFDILDYNCVTGQTTGATQRVNTSCKVGTEGGQNVSTARAALRYRIVDGVEDNFIVDTIHDDSENPAAKLTVQKPIWAGTNNYLTGPTSYSSYATYTGDPGKPTQFSYPNKTTMHGWGLSNSLTANLADVAQLTSITGFRTSHAFFTLDLDASPADVLDQIWGEDYKQVTQEIRLSGTAFNNWLEWTAGGFYYDASGVSRVRLDIQGGLAPGGGGIGLELLNNDPVSTTSKSGFGQLVGHLTDKLSLTAALRYTKDQKEYTFNRYDPNGNPSPVLGSLNGITGKFSGSRLDYRGNIDYQLADHTLVYAQIATGFKGGGVNPRPYYPSQVVPFQPETLTGYETGIKGDFLDRTLRVNAALFYNKFKNIQGQINSCPQFTPNGAAGPCALTTNIGDATLKGAELETEYHPTENWLINASLGYLNFNYTRVDPLTGVSENMVSVFTPKWTGSTGVQYSASLGSHGSITPRLDYNFLSSTYSNAVNTPLTYLSSRGLVNARLTWKNADDIWESSLAVTNLLDTFRIINHFETGEPIYNAQVGQPTHPREWLVSVKRRF